jgi:hypothetical protein
MTATGRYACHNRPEPARDLLVQDGWLDTIGESAAGLRLATRLPVMVRVAVLHRPECLYTLERPHDPQCAGCCWQQAQ